MPDAKTHKLVGAGTGAIYAGYRAKDQSNPNWWVEVAGGAVGGYVGGLLPDILEPATSPQHRDLAHSWVAGGGIVGLHSAIEAWEAACRENAEKCRALPMAAQVTTFVHAPIDPISQLLFSLFEFLWRFSAGFANGLTVGYVSHLALDAATPSSLPWLTNGF
jgi:hypothetical protein